MPAIPGRRLGGEEIRAAFAGRRLSGVFWPNWGARVTRTTRQHASGERRAAPFHPAHPERRIASCRWAVEGDRLYPTDDRCNAVLQDGRLLHVVSGEPQRVRAAFIAPPPGPRSWRGRAGLPRLTDDAHGGDVAAPLRQPRLQRAVQGA
ncbi:MAG: hypothetical protein ICV73_03415 [Acetobacteraceae bacterium]|nr:hypothetical protein [Acetobacteraceae bacterium]